ncbi:glycoside hydrolase family 5 protein [Pedobacter sp.]|nr:glycoside hydrolase family 5 protein [Candidatus Saccharibacteria bacterium]
MTKALQGINLGGWLVLERWITPSVFAGTIANDEWSLGQELGESSMKQKLQQHRDTFITKKDIAWIAEQGFSIVRLPVGYWVFNDRDGFYGSIEYVDLLFAWAEEYGLRVILDLHGAPGSQNGWDHSGKAGLLGWHTQEAYISESLVVLEQLAYRYGADPALYGVEVLNEPRWDIPLKVLLGFYMRAYAVLRSICGGAVKVIVSDSFRLKDMTAGLRAIGLADVIVDSHRYQLFSDEDKWLDFKGHLKKVIMWRREIQQQAKYFPIMIGEWSATLGHSTFTGSLEKEISAMTVEYFRKQQEVFNTEAAIWCYWTYKTEQISPWSYRDQSIFGLK